MQLRLRPSVSSKQQDGKDKVISGWLDVPRGWERKVWAQDSFVHGSRNEAWRISRSTLVSTFLSAPWRRSIRSGIHDYTSREFCGVDARVISRRFQGQPCIDGGTARDNLPARFRGGKWVKRKRKDRRTSLWPIRGLKSGY